MGYVVVEMDSVLIEDLPFRLMVIGRAACLLVLLQELTRGLPDQLYPQPFWSSIVASHRLTIFGNLFNELAKKQGGIGVFILCTDICSKYVQRKVPTTATKSKVSSQL